MKCITCHLRPQHGGRRLCAPCIAVAAKGRAEWITSRRAAARKEGKCLQCFKRKADKTATRCTTCHVKEQHRHRRRQCRDCAAPATSGTVRCDACRDKNAAGSRAYQARKRENPDEYVPLDEWLSKPRVRVMRALRRLGWAEPMDVWSVLGLAECDALERDRFAQALRRLVQTGDAEMRRTRSLTGGYVYEYRLISGVSIDPPMDKRVCSDAEAA